MIVPGKPHPEIRRDVWRERCDALADEIHYRPDDVYDWFEQLWLCRVAELRWPRGLAKWQALRDARASLDRRGMEAD